VQRRSYLKHLKVQKKQVVNFHIYAVSSIWINAQPLRPYMVLIGTSEQGKTLFLIHTLKMIFDFINLKGFKGILQAPWINSMLPQ
jgi:hypothetical protein